MAGSDLISVIMPVYNREKYINKGIESVISQKNVNIEMILIDDGSSDNSPDIKVVQKNSYLMFPSLKKYGCGCFVLILICISLSEAY